jgi:hypothetical protein
MNNNMHCSKAFRSIVYENDFYCLRRWFVLSMNRICIIYGVVFICYEDDFLCEGRGFVIYEDDFYCPWRWFVRSMKTICTVNEDDLYCEWRQFVLPMKMICTAMKMICTVYKYDLYCLWRRSVLWMKRICAVYEDDLCGEWRRFVTSIKMILITNDLQRCRMISGELEPSSKDLESFLRRPICTVQKPSEVSSMKMSSIVHEIQIITDNTNHYRQYKSS